MGATAASPADTQAAVPVDPPASRPLKVVTIVLFVILAVCSGIFETLLIPLYIGSANFPITIAIAVAGNFVLAMMACRAAGSAVPGTVSLIVWTITVYFMVFGNDDKGDVFVLGSYGQAPVAYGLLFGGLMAGGVALARFTAQRPVRRI